MICSLCGWRFTVEEGITSCNGCPIKGGCEMLRCPVCGYETPKLPKSRRDKNGNQ